MLSETSYYQIFHDPRIQSMNPISDGNLQLKNLDLGLAPSGPGVGGKKMLDVRIGTQMNSFSKF